MVVEKKKSGFNFLRKGWHFLGLFIPLSLYFDAFKGFYNLENATRAVLVCLLAISLVILGLLEVLRFRYPAFGGFFWKVLGPLMKEGERDSVNGTIPYFLANLVVILFFTPELAVLSLSFLVIGDPFAAYVGSHYGKHRFYNGKSLEGILAFILSSSLFGLLIIAMFSNSSETQGASTEILVSKFGLSIGMVLVLFLGSISAGVAEFFSTTTWKGFLDDNLLIPIVSCFVMTVASGLVLGLDWNDVFFKVSNLFQ